MAHKKGMGSTSNGRDSNPKYLGCKKFDGEIVKGGTVLVRQRGTRFFPGDNAGKGKDDTIFAKVSGKVKYFVRNNRRYIGIIAEEMTA